MTILLICGSREFDSSIQASVQTYVDACVRRALDNGWSLIAGDCYAGVDKWVAQSVARWLESYDSYDWQDFITIYGVQDNPRHKIMAWGFRYHDICNHEGCGITVTDFTTRDRFMVHQANKIMCIWNGASKGTHAVFEYAKANGFTENENVWLKEFKV